MKDKKRRTYGFLTGLLLILSVCLTSCGNQGQTDSGKDSNTQSGTKVAAEDHSAEEKGSDSESYVTVDDVPAYSGEPYVEVNDNQPEFTEEELTTVSYEDYSELDELGRCQLAEACIGQDLMPTEARESISSVKPTGWKNKSYDTVDGGYVYNRCHLIGFQLTGENANEENLITGTPKSISFIFIGSLLPKEQDNLFLKYPPASYLPAVFARRSFSLPDIDPSDRKARSVMGQTKQGLVHIVLSRPLAAQSLFHQYFSGIPAG